MCLGCAKVDGLGDISREVALSIFYGEAITHAVVILSNAAVVARPTTLPVTTYPYSVGKPNTFFISLG